jgi:hypothetical protein
MISLRSQPARAGIVSALTLLALCAAMLVLPAAGIAEPPPGEGSPPQPPLPPQLSFEPGSYDFGLQQVNNGNNQTTIQLRNTGEAPAPVYSLELNGSGTFQIGQSDCYGKTLNPSESCYVQINFNPWDVVAFSAQLRATSEAGTSFTAALSGEGGQANLTTAASSTNFGSVAVGSAGVTRTIDVTNTGNYPGGAFIAVIAGGAVGSFHLLDENCTGVPLSPRATCNLVVSFQPLSTGAKTARLGLFGESDGGTQVMLTGVGLDPAVAPALPNSPSPGAIATKPRRHRGKPRRGSSLHHFRHRRVDVSSARLSR